MRQLANVLRRALLAQQGGEHVTLESLLRPVGGVAAPAPVQAAAPDAGAPQPRRLASIGHEEVLAAMEQNGWCILDAARALGVSRPSMYKLLALNPLIREAADIPEHEIRLALAQNGNDPARCAAALKTPGEALRRHLRLRDGAN